MVHSRSICIFRNLRANIRALLVASLLLLGHIVFTTLSHTSTEELYESSEPPFLLSPKRAFSRLSALIFITLLWQCFILFEQADAKSSVVIVESSSTSEVSGTVKEKMRLERPNRSLSSDDHVVLFSSTLAEGLMGLISLGVWTISGQTLYQICALLSPRVSVELYIIAPLIITSYLCVVLLNVQLLFELTRRAFRGDLKDAWWRVPTGSWVGRVELDEQA